ncbi:MAG: 16S rRNA (cytidine(1402)-2'-O)-methyltransferase [Oscillospiraceae bacterium]|nr:16S rRNA (cytidine(1402)-2'-O)-methyltransferase [Oscillospiraceae bacterium]
MSGTLYIVATPIGNLGDLSQRASEIMSDVDFIAAEDTRVSRKLLEYLKIKKELVSYHEHNSKESGDKITSRILAGESCALVTDAGTPGISDPGERLISKCADLDINIVSIPGPCAAIAALVLSALPIGRFTFEGFLSTSKKSRFAHLDELKTEKRTMVFYEAPHKIKRTLNDMLTVFGDRRISISREITKIYEETIRLSLSEAVLLFEEKIPKGEYVLIVEGISESKDTQEDFNQVLEKATLYVSDGMSLMDAAKKAAEESGVSKNKLYNAILKGQQA